MDCEVIERLCSILRKGQRAALSLIISSIGSTPRRPGAAILFEEQGSSHFSIGGGVLELTSSKDALSVFRSSSPIERTISFNNNESQCGGKAVMLTTLIYEDLLDLFASALRMLNERRTALLVIEMLREGDLSVIWDVEPLDDLTSKYAEILSEHTVEHGSAHPNILTTCTKDKSYVFITLSPPPQLHIFGAGHIAASLVPLASAAGFRVTVIDDRPEYAFAERFPLAKDVILAGQLEGYFSHREFDSSDYIVIASHSHSRDEYVLSLACNAKAGYIGMIGSNRKREAIFSRLCQRGMKQEWLSKVHCPIGIEIGAEGAFEVAVSIIAEIISLRRKKLGSNS